MYQEQKNNQRTSGKISFPHWAGIIIRIVKVGCKNVK